ncbi:WD40-repeat-containing domain, partial [Trinorchestia longiramus]
MNPHHLTHHHLHHLTHQVKLSAGRSADIQLCWATAGVMAVSAGDGSVRLWDTDTGDNFVLSLKTGLGFKDNESIMCLSYCHTKNVLCAGTGFGRMAMWKYEPQSRPPDASLYAPLDPEKDWALQAPTTLAGQIKQMAWGSSQSLLAVNTVRDVHVLYEQAMVTSYDDQVCVVQVSPKQLQIHVFSAGTEVTLDAGQQVSYPGAPQLLDGPADLSTGQQVRGVHNSQDNILVWNSSNMAVFQLNADASAASRIGSWEGDNEGGAVRDNSVIVVEADVIT